MERGTEKRVRRAIVFVLMGLATLCRCQAAEQTLPVDLYRGYLLVAHCSVAGQTGLTGVIDTGTTETVLDIGLVRRLSLRTWADSATSVDKESQVRGVSIPDLRLGPVHIGKLDGIATDLSYVRGELGRHPDLVIGMDVLHRSNFTIDYKTHSIVFGAAQALAHGTLLISDSRFALVDSKVLGKTVRLQVDTGFKGLLLYGGRLGLLLRGVDAGAKMSEPGRTLSVHSAGLREVRIGDWRSSNLNVFMIEDGPRDFAKFDGLLGPRVLGAQHVAFDFDHGMLYWD